MNLFLLPALLPLNPGWNAVQFDISNATRMAVAVWPMAKKGAEYKLVARPTDMKPAESLRGLALFKSVPLSTRQLALKFRFADGSMDTINLNAAVLAHSLSRPVKVTLGNGSTLIQVGSRSMRLVRKGPAKAPPKRPTKFH